MNYNLLNYFLTIKCVTEKDTVLSFKNYLSNYIALKAKCLRLNPAHHTVEEAAQALQITKEYLNEINNKSLVEVAIPHSNAKPRINQPPKELCLKYKKGDIIKLYKTFREDQFSADLNHLNISVGKSLTWGDWIGLFSIVDDNEEYVQLKFNRDQELTSVKKPVVILDTKTNRNYNLSQKDIDLIDVSVKHGADIISCSFSTNRAVIEEYFHKIQDSVRKYNAKRPLVILKMEEGEFVSDENLDYLRSVKSLFNGLSISRGDLYCNHGNKCPVYETKLLEFAKNENIPIRMFTMVGENYVEGFTRNDFFSLYSYISSNIDMIGFADESIYWTTEDLRNIIRDIEEIAYHHRIKILENESLTEKQFNDIMFLVPQEFNGILKNKNFYINSFNNIKEYIKYCLFKGTIII